MTKPRVSILCITYNQGRFIRDALDGFIMQKTNFPFEVLIHDDASTDGTADIIREYAKKYPDIIKPILQTENQWSKGKYVDKRFNWPRITGEYVAINEGDDYWTDPHKLQKQVDFLEAHPDYSVCFHPVRVVWDNGAHPDSIFPSKKHRFHKTTLELSDLLKHNFIQTNSVMYRWRRECIDLYPDGILPGDWYVHLLHAQVGKIGFIPDVMSVYRRNDGGIWTGAYESDAWFEKYGLPIVKFYENATKQFNHDFSSAQISVASSLLCAYLRSGNVNKISEFRKMYPDLYECATKRINCYDCVKLTNKYHKYKKLFFVMIALVVVLMVYLIINLFN